MTLLNTGCPPHGIAIRGESSDTGIFLPVIAGLDHFIEANPINDSSLENSVLRMTTSPIISHD